MSRSGRWIFISALVLPLLAAWSGVGATASSWKVDLNYSSVTSNVPFSRDTSCTVSSSYSTTWYSGHGAGSPGAIAASCRTDTHWDNGLSGGGGARTYGSATTNDFVISGSGGSVAATLHLRLVASFALNGGFPGNGGTGHVWVNVNANGIGNFGEYTFNSAGSSGTGVLAGYSGPVIEVPIHLSGNFPVNSPFTVTLLIETNSGTYGNVNTNEGMASANAVLRLDDLSGVMTLPEGYTLNSPSWNVTNNHWSPTVAVDPAPVAGGLDLRLTGANPAHGDVSLTCLLPFAGNAQVAIFDPGGRRVRTLADGWSEAGRHSFVWDGRTDDGARSPDGVFFARITAGGHSVMRRIVRIR